MAFKFIHTFHTPEEQEIHFPRCICLFLFYFIFPRTNKHTCVCTHADTRTHSSRHADHKNLIRILLGGLLWGSWLKIGTMLLYTLNNCFEHKLENQLNCVTLLCSYAGKHLLIKYSVLSLINHNLTTSACEMFVCVRVIQIHAYHKAYWNISQKSSWKTKQNVAKWPSKSYI